MGEFNNYSYTSPRSCHSVGNLDPVREQPVLSQEAWRQRQAEFDERHQADIQAAIAEANVIGADVHLYRKVGSQFLGIALKEAPGPRTRVWEWPEIRA